MCNQHFQYFQYAVNLVKYSCKFMNTWGRVALLWLNAAQTLLPLYLHCRPADRPFPPVKKHPSYLIKNNNNKKGQTSTSALGHDWMFNAVDVQITQDVYEGTKSYLLCSVSAVKKGKPSV